jgi:hypothetical protein
MAEVERQHEVEAKLVDWANHWGYPAMVPPWGEFAARRVGPGPEFEGGVRTDQFVLTFDLFRPAHLEASMWAEIREEVEAFVKADPTLGERVRHAACQGIDFEPTDDKLSRGVVHLAVARD